MARFTDWRVKRTATGSDPGGHADLHDVGSKMLAALEVQRRASGIKTIGRTVQMPNGDTVQAAFFGDIPITTVSRRKTGGDVLAATFRGFVTSARTFGDPTWFDSRPDIIVTDKLDEVPQRRKYVFAPGMGGKPYKVNEFGQELYFLSPDTPPTPPGDRINSFGYVDWRDASEDVTINYGGAPSRYFAFNGEWLGQYVYHNGEALLDNNAVTGDGGAVAGACISRGYLVWCTVQTGGFGGSLTYKLYRAKIKRGLRPGWVAAAQGVPVLLGPRYKPVEAIDAELLYTAEVDAGEYQFYGSNVFFNQAGTELRGLYYNTDATTLYALELTINFADWDAIAGNSVQLGAYSETTTVTRSYPVCRANTTRHLYTEIDDVDTIIFLGGPLAVGSYTVSNSSMATYVHPKAKTFIPGRSLVSDTFQNPYLLALEATYTRTITPTVDGNFPVAVDFQDNRPVYAYLHPSSLTESCDYTGTCDITETYDHSYTFDITPGGPANEVDHIIYQQELSATSSSTYSHTGAGLGLWVPKTRPEDTVGNWLDVQLTFSDSGTTSADSESLLDTDKAADTSSASASYNATRNVGYTEQASVSVWWMDLRTDCIAFSTVRKSRTADQVLAYTGSSSGGWAGVFDEEYLLSLTGSTDSTATFLREAYTSVVINRVQVDSCSGYLPIADEVTSDTDPLTDYDRGWFGWRALGFAELSSLMFDAFQLGGLFDSAVLDAWEALYSVNPPFNFYGPMDAPDYVVDPESDTTTIDDRVSTATAPAGTPELTAFGAGGVSDVMCPGNWALQGNLFPDSDFDRVPGGAWIYLRGDWAFSMAWLNGDTSSIQWHHRIRGDDPPDGQTLDDISGFTAESYAPMWPFAKALYAYQRT